MEYTYQGHTVAFELEQDIHHRESWTTVIDGRAHSFDVQADGPSGVTVTEDGCARRWSVVREGSHLILESDGAEYVLSSPPGLRAAAFHGGAARAAGTLRAPMPGVVVRVLVEAGDHVRLRQPVIVLEAMKMEHMIESPLDGLVTHIACSVGDKVAEGDLLAEIASEEE